MGLPHLRLSPFPSPLGLTQDFPAKVKQTGTKGQAGNADPAAASAAGGQGELADVVRPERGPAVA